MTTRAVFGAVVAQLHRQIDAGRVYTAVPLRLAAQDEDSLMDGQAGRQAKPMLLMLRMNDKRPRLILGQMHPRIGVIMPQQHGPEQSV